MAVFDELGAGIAGVAQVKQFDALPQRPRYQIYEAATCWRP